MKFSAKLALLALGIIVISMIASAQTLPIGTLRPVDTFATYSTDPNIVCNTKPGTIRHVTPSVRKFVFRRDGVPGGNHTGICAGARGCELDHRVSLELGGNNDPDNLWVQPYTGACNADMKDDLERELTRRVCKEHSLDLMMAQTAIYYNWEQAYEDYINPYGCR